MNRNGASKAFTLIELSIVLVIIGLIVGGILVGRELIESATIRGQIAQIDKYNQAVNTFYGKYGGLPGDLISAKASQFGFIARGTGTGRGDGDGQVLGWGRFSSYAKGNQQQYGETASFWVDLSTARLIDQNFSAATQTTGTDSTYTSTEMPLYYPQAKVGSGNYVFAFAGGYDDTSQWVFSGANYFGIVAATSVTTNGPVDQMNMPVIMAYKIDEKMDDGLPQSGNVLAIHIHHTTAANATCWANDSCNDWTTYTWPRAASATTCFDNGNQNATQKYSITYENGRNVNCALSFKFQ